MEYKRHDKLLNPILISCCVIILTSFAVRASFGVFQLPIATEFNWPRAEFSFAIAIQNLFWGIGQPIFSAIAEKFGDKKAITLGALSYAAGLILSSYAITPEQHQWFEILVGMGIAGMGFGVILAVVGRATSDKNRSLALGIATAAGSAGQIIGPPLAEILLQHLAWQSVFFVFAYIILASLISLFFMGDIPKPTTAKNEDGLAKVVKQAIKDPTFAMIFIGFFSCGYQLAFITAHFPAYVTEICAAISPGSLISSIGITTTSALGAASIALIGLANIGGTILAGWLGSLYSRKLLLVAIYLARTIVAMIFILLPMTPWSVIIFSIAMGALWLATVPLTSGLVAQIYGLKYMGTLYGLVFFSHQLGGFLGVWLGGRMYDLHGDYTAVWWIGIGVGLLSAIIHIPINERPIAERGGLAPAE